MKRFIASVLFLFFCATSAQAFELNESNAPIPKVKGDKEYSLVDKPFNWTIFNGSSSSEIVRSKALGQDFYLTGEKRCFIINFVSSYADKIINDVVGDSDELTGCFYKTTTGKFLQYIWVEDENGDLTPRYRD